MNRHYSVEHYLDQIDDIVSRFDKPFLGSDIIAGFVGETDNDFETTVENLKNQNYHKFTHSLILLEKELKLQNFLIKLLKQKRLEEPK